MPEANIFCVACLGTLHQVQEQSKGSSKPACQHFTSHLITCFTILLFLLNKNQIVTNLTMFAASLCDSMQQK